MLGIGYFRVLNRKLKANNGSGTVKVGFGRIREFPKFEKSGSGMLGIEKTQVQEFPDPSLIQSSHELNVSARSNIRFWFVLDNLIFSGFGKY